MYKGIYIAASGAVLKQTQLEVISQNLANANTAGYKKDRVSFKDYLFQTEASSTPDGRDMTEYSGSKTDLSNGNTVSTGNNLDIAVEGDGFIALEGNRYTRKGDMKKDSEGFLTTHDGTKVLGQSGPINLPADSVQISIDSEGKVSVLTSGNTLPTEIDTIKVVDFGPDANLTKMGDSMFTANADAGTPSTATIKQGYLETSNVNVVKEMVQMIQTMREFETYQKAIQAFDSATSKVTNDLGRL
jgi:flagellar basal-body rod protein FlgF